MQCGRYQPKYGWKIQCLFHRPLCITKTEEMSLSPENGRGLDASKSSAVSDGSTATPRGKTGNMQTAVNM